MEKENDTKELELEFEGFELTEETEVDDSVFDSLVENEVLTEEEATTIKDSYKAAVHAAVKKLIAESVNPHYEGQLQSLVEEAKEVITDSVSDYLEYVVEEFIEENKEQIVASETGKQDRTIVEGLVSLLEDNLVNIPEGREDLVESLSSELSEAQQEISNLEDVTISLRNQVKGMKCEAIFEEASKDMTDSQREKFLGLVEDISINDVDEFERKTKSIRETLFSRKKDDSSLEEETLEEEELLSSGEGENTPPRANPNDVLRQAAEWNRRSKNQRAEK